MLFSLSIMFLRFVHIVAYYQISFLFIELFFVKPLESLAQPGGAQPLSDEETEAQRGWGLAVTRAAPTQQGWPRLGGGVPPKATKRILKGDNHGITNLGDLRRVEMFSTCRVVEVKQVFLRFPPPLSTHLGHKG